MAAFTSRVSPRSSRTWSAQRSGSMRPSRGFRATAERVTRMTPYLRETMRWPTLTVSMAAGFVFMVTSGLVSCCADIRNISSLPGAVQLPAITNLRELHERSVLLRPDVAQHRVLDVLARSEEHTSELQSLMRTP